VTALVASRIVLATPNTNETNQSTQPHPQQQPGGYQHRLIISFRCGGTLKGDFGKK